MEKQITASAQVYWWESKQNNGRGNFNFEHYAKVLQAKAEELKNEQTRDVRTDIKVCL